VNGNAGYLPQTSGGMSFACIRLLASTYWTALACGQPSVRDAQALGWQRLLCVSSQIPNVDLLFCQTIQPNVFRALAFGLSGSGHDGIRHADAFWKHIWRHSYLRKGPLRCQTRRENFPSLSPPNWLAV
jgi:hypothetical protein